LSAGAAIACEASGVSAVPAGATGAKHTPIAAIATGAKHAPTAAIAAGATVAEEHAAPATTASGAAEHAGITTLATAVAEPGTAARHARSERPTNVAAAARTAVCRLFGQPLGGAVGVMQRLVAQHCEAGCEMPELVAERRGGCGRRRGAQRGQSYPGEQHRRPV
jgi:hypothetical protein